MALSCYQIMVFSAVSQPEAIMMRGWLSTFARSAGSSIRTRSPLRHFEPPSGKYLLGESGRLTSSHHQV